MPMHAQGCACSSEGQSSTSDICLPLALSTPFFLALLLCFHWSRGSCMCRDAYVLVRAQVMGIGPSTPPRGSSDLMEKLINSARLAGYCAPGLCLSLPPQSWGYRHTQVPDLFAHWGANSAAHACMAAIFPGPLTHTSKLCSDLYLQFLDAEPFCTPKAIGTHLFGMHEFLGGFPENTEHTGKQMLYGNHLCYSGPTRLRKCLSFSYKSRKHLQKRPSYRRAKTCHRVCWYTFRK